jgi:hypothetical protein
MMVSEAVVIVTVTVTVTAAIVTEAAVVVT